MQGFKLTFFTQQDRSVHGQSLALWLIQQAKEIGIRGATLTAATEGFGHDKKLHSTHFFELTEQPLQITMAVTAEEAEQMFALLNKENINIFYTQAAIEFGMSGER
ncbi:DUF190 domain-containing protein [Tolumonas lignilytica]|uniref:DUF190 domain-containing protein n=1 Tax=Tolumonas lignilytica TaxID=1283284 RepID=UPI0004652608|nr:DUF190 domain-containing protein [Tolumonas lignilytica]